MEIVVDWMLHYPMCFNLYSPNSYWLWAASVKAPIILWAVYVMASCQPKSWFAASFVYLAFIPLWLTCVQAAIFVYSTCLSLFLMCVCYHVCLHKAFPILGYILVNTHHMFAPSTFFLFWDICFVNKHHMFVCSTFFLFWYICLWISTSGYPQKVFIFFCAS